MLREVRVPFGAGEMVSGTLVRRTDRFLAEIKLDGDRGTVSAHCINPGRMEAFVDPGAVVWARRHDGGAAPSKRKTKWTWELILRDGVVCSANTRRPNELVGAALRERALAGFERATEITAEKNLPKHGGERTNSRCDFYCVDADGFDHWIEVKSSHSSYPEEPALRGWGYFPDSVSLRAAKHCRELARLAARPRTRCTILIVASRGDATEGVRVSDYHDPAFCSAARAARDAGVRFRALRATHAAHGTTVNEEVPVDLDPPPRATLDALHRSWTRATAITGWDRTVGPGPAKRVANAPFAHNRGKFADAAPPRRRSAHFPESPHFPATPPPKKRKR